MSVFCGGKKNELQKSENGVNVFKIKALNKEIFRENVVSKFSEIHLIKNFDIVESPDYGADGYFVKIAFPLLPYVVKLHSPSYLIEQYSNYYLQYIFKKNLKNFIKSKLKKIIGKKVYSEYKKENDIEYKNALLANLVTSPSKGLLKKIIADWRLRKNKTIVIENIYKPSLELLAIPLKYNYNRVTLIGKISLLKGLLEFVDVIPVVLEKFPYLQFRFIGLDTTSPEAKTTMSEFIKRKCKNFINNIEFTGQVQLDTIPKYLAETDIVVCNSLWENYPTVILEAMSAGRIVIGTRVGGIPEIIENKKNGFLIESKKSSELSECIIKFYEDISVNTKLGNGARNYIVTKNSNEHILLKVKESYFKTILECSQ